MVSPDQPLERNESRIDVLDAPCAGMKALNSPISSATPMQMPHIVGEIDILAMFANCTGELFRPEIRTDANKSPMTPPTSEIIDASPKIMPRTSPLVNPRVF